MSAHKIPCWYARTIIPSKTYNSDKVFFGRLKTEPLGNLIFDSNQVQRVSLINYPITPDNIEYYWITNWLKTNPTTVWARLSTFNFNSKFPFFLLEIFLPDFNSFDTKDA